MAASRSFLLIPFIFLLNSVIFPIFSVIEITDLGSSIFLNEHLVGNDEFPACSRSLPFGFLTKPVKFLRISVRQKMLEKRHFQCDVFPVRNTAFMFETFSD
jgi:hypothetical protein